MNLREHEQRDGVKVSLSQDEVTALLDAALQHLVESHTNLEDMKQDLTPDQAEALSTSELSLTMYPQVRK